MEIIGTGLKPASKMELGYAISGKSILSIDNIRVDVGTSRAVLIRNKGPNTLFVAQVERFESEIVSFIVDGSSSIDLDFIFTPNLSGTTEISLSEASAYRVSNKGVVNDIPAPLFDLVEVVGFDKAAVGNRKIEIENNNLSYFFSNQSTTVSEDSREKTFAIPYALGSGAEVVLCITNELKIESGLDAFVDIVISGYVL